VKENNLTLYIRLSCVHGVHVGRRLDLLCRRRSLARVQLQIVDKFSHTCARASVTRQYYLVLTKGQWCFGKVAAA